MWKEIGWMRRADHAILEWLDRTNIVATPAVIARNINYHPNYVGERLAELVDHDLAIREEEGWYRISPRGKEFIRGETILEEIQESAEAASQEDDVEDSDEDDNGEN